MKSRRGFLQAASAALGAIGLPVGLVGVQVRACNGVGVLVMDVAEIDQP